MPLLLAVVIVGTEGLPIVFIPEQHGIATVRRDVIHDSGYCHSSSIHAHHTQRMKSKVSLARFLPSVVISTLGAAAAARLILLTTMLAATPVVSEHTAPGIGAGSLGGAWHGNQKRKSPTRWPGFVGSGFFEDTSTSVTKLLWFCVRVKRSRCFLNTLPPTREPPVASSCKNCAKFASNAPWPPVCHSRCTPSSLSRRATLFHRGYANRPSAGQSALKSDRRPRWRQSSVSPGCQQGCTSRAQWCNAWRHGIGSMCDR